MARRDRSVPPAVDGTWSRNGDEAKSKKNLKPNSNFLAVSGRSTVKSPYPSTAGLKTCASTPRVPEFTCPAAGVADSSAARATNRMGDDRLIIGSRGSRNDSARDQHRKRRLGTSSRHDGAWA